MRALVIDDEELAIYHLVNLLKRFSFITEIVTFHVSGEALNYLNLHQVEIAFIDIEMPEINGIKLAEEIQKSNPACKIIFISAYDQYAVKAFELQATDYLVKPVTYKRLQITMERAYKKLKAKKPRLCLLGDLKILVQSEAAIVFDKWRTQKVKDVFLYLLHERNKNIHRDTLIELFWQEKEISKSIASLHRMVYYLRKMLESHQPILNNAIEIIRTDIGYQLKVNNIEVDVDLFEKKLKELSNIRKVDATNYKEIEVLVSLYNGNYLDNADYWWIEGERNKYREIWIYYSSLLLDYYFKEKMYQEVITLANRIQKLDPLEDMSYRILIKLYQETGNKQGEKFQISMLEQISH